LNPQIRDDAAESRSALFAELARGRAEPLDLGGPVIEVDTTDFDAVDQARLAATVRELLS
jgi:hypothetical protein